MGAFHQSINRTPDVFDSQKAERTLAELGDSARAAEELGDLALLLETSEPVRDLVNSIFGSSSYLTGLILRDPLALQDWLMSDPDERLAVLGAEMERDLSEAMSQEAAMRGLRRYKNRLEGLIYSNERVFEQFQQSVDERQKKQIHQSFLRARMALNEDDRADLEAAIFDLNTISQKLSQIMLENTEADSKAG